MKGLLSDVLDGFQNPMTLGGLSLLTGGDMNSGIAAGTQLQRQAQQRKQQEAMQQGLLGMPNLSDSDRQILGNSPDLANSVLSDIYKQRFDPNAALDTEYRKAQIAKLRRDATGQGDTPANIREWQAFQAMTPEQQTRYLTMKRADKYLNDGTSYRLPNQLDPAGDPLAVVPINNAEKAAQTAAGKLQGPANFNFPMVEHNANELVRLIDDALGDEYLRNMIGPVSGRMMNITADANRVQSKMDQIGGKTFLQAYETLKGAGQITEIEGTKAEAALNRLKTVTQGTQHWIDAANDFKREVLAIVAIKRQQAGGGGAPSFRSMSAPQPQQPAAPAANGWSIKRLD